MAPAWLSIPLIPRDPPPLLAVAIHIGQRGASHAGVIHGTDDGGRQLLHLASQRELCSDTYFCGMAWVVPNLEEETIRSLTGVCRLIWDRYGGEGLEYAFRWAGSIFSLADGSLELGPGESGFTCASFVLAVFKSAGITLVDAETWPSRDDDHEWQDRMKRYLTDHDRDPAYRRRLDAQNRSLRFRPAEVVGACAVGDWPASFKKAEAAGAEIVESLPERTTWLP